MKKRKTEAQGRIWVEVDGVNFLGSGRIELLGRIETLGSLRQAAASMGLSYRRAYYSVRSMNEVAPSPLVELRQGGKGGGSAKLTETGRKYIAAYQDLSRRFVTFLTESAAAFSDDFFLL